MMEEGWIDRFFERFVIGTPVGFVHFLTLLELEISLTKIPPLGVFSARKFLLGFFTPKELKSAAESNEVLRNTDISSISNIGIRGGGVPIAVACINELISILNEKNINLI